MMGRRLARVDLERLNRWLGPPLSLAAGLVAVFFVRREAGFAPLAVAILLAAWFAAALLSRLLSRLENVAEPRRAVWRKALGFLLRSFVSGLYQNVLFFLLPLYFVSSTWPSENMGFSLLLAAMAVFSCVEEWLRPLVLEKPGPRAAWSGVILFAALVPACSVLIELPLRWTIAGAAAICAASAVAASAPAGRKRRNKVLLAVLAGALSLLAMLPGARLIPPVPVQCLDAASGGRIADRELETRAEDFPEKAGRVYSWFAVAAPERFRGAVRFEYLFANKRVGRPFESTVTGGRKAGFRTWCYFTDPWPGEWSVELRTDAGQLIARQGFRVHSLGTTETE